LEAFSTLERLDSLTGAKRMIVRTQPPKEARDHEEMQAAADVSEMR
jgi:hypothetical protein